jgi:tyrosinase
MIVRKNVNTLTSAEKQQFVQAVLALKNNNQTGNIYNQYVTLHGQASNHFTPTGSTRTAAHGGPAFLAWHREFIRRFELDLQTVAPGIGIPYWDWAADAALPNPKTAPVWSNDMMGGDGDASDGSYAVKTGPFAYGRWTVVYETGSPIRYSGGKFTGALKRQFGAGVATLPSQASIDTALKAFLYDTSPWDKSSSSSSHRNQMEGNINSPQMHNRVHRWIGQTMRLLTSPNDPVFFLHHSNIDRIWAQWQAASLEHGYLPVTDGPAGHNLNDAMFPWNTAPINVLDHQALGYKYDTEP